jgi:hypothetical protein
MFVHHEMWLSLSMPWSNIAFLSLDKLASQKNKVSATR